MGMCCFGWFRRDGVTSRLAVGFRVGMVWTPDVGVFVVFPRERLVVLNVALGLVWMRRAVVFVVVDGFDVDGVRVVGFGDERARCVVVCIMG